MARSEPLLCPSCATPHSLEQIFCPECGRPLVYSSPAQARAHKIRPEYTRGELHKVAGSRNQAEAELIQGLLLEEGVPSMLRRSRGFDVPDMLAAGPRDVVVPASGLDAAREILLQSELLPLDDGRPGDPELRAVDPPARILLGLVAALALVALLTWAATALLS
jgi:hypothetical protein